MTKALKILTIDGGGMRGLYSAAYLHELLYVFGNHRNVDPDELDFGNAFDLIVGTSTGGILACALAHGSRPAEIMALYREHGPQIFSLKLSSKLRHLLRDIRCRPEALAKGTKALTDALEHVFGNVTVSEIWDSRQIALAIPAIDMSRHAPWVFKTNHLSRLKGRDDAYRLVDVCLATTAAPIYRSLAEIPNTHGEGTRTFADGGLWANSPTIVGLLDALDMSELGDRLEFFCLSTCPRPEGEVVTGADVRRGLPGWNFGGNAAALSIDAQESAGRFAIREILKHVQRDSIVVDFPRGPVAGSIMKYLELDETTEEGMAALVSQAQTDANATLSRCSQGASGEDRLLNTLLETIPTWDKDHARRTA